MKARVKCNDEQVSSLGYQLSLMTMTVVISEVLSQRLKILLLLLVCEEEKTEGELQISL